jgi:serine/threonine protein kinase
MRSIYREIGVYEILGTLGSGGMADVYVARDRQSGVQVALKVPRPDADFRRAELEGARLQRHLSVLEPRIPRIYAIDEDGGVPYIAMEFVEGEDLASRLSRGPLEPREALRIAIELGEILAVVHECT